MEIWKVAPLLSGLVAIVLLVLWGIGVKVAELSRTLKRIEARMTLTNPLEEETALMELIGRDAYPRDVKDTFKHAQEKLKTFQAAQHTDGPETSPHP